MLAGSLLLSPERLRILLAAMFASVHSEVSGILDPICTVVRLDGDAVGDRVGDGYKAGREPRLFLMPSRSGDNAITNLSKCTP